MSSGVKSSAYAPVPAFSKAHLLKLYFWSTPVEMEVLADLSEIDGPFA